MPRPTLACLALCGNGGRWDYCSHDALEEVEDHLFWQRRFPPLHTLGIEQGREELAKTKREGEVPRRDGDAGTDYNVCGQTRIVVTSQCPNHQSVLDMLYAIPTRLR
jgi:hypothetical protein